MAAIGSPSRGIAWTSMASREESSATRPGSLCAQTRSWHRTPEPALDRALRLVDDRNVRRDVLVLDEPVEVAKTSPAGGEGHSGPSTIFAAIPEVRALTK